MLTDPSYSWLDFTEPSGNATYEEGQTSKFQGKHYNIHLAVTDNKGITVLEPGISQ